MHCRETEAWRGGAASAPHRSCPPNCPLSLVAQMRGDGPAPLPDPDGEHAEQVFPLQPASEHDQAWEEMETHT